MIELLLLAQVLQQDLAPQDMEAIPGVSWNCSVLHDERPFRLAGRAPDFASKRVKGESLRTEVRSTGPEWSKGTYSIAAEAGSEDFRRYILTWNAPEGQTYLLDMVLLRGKTGIATLTDVSRPDQASPRLNRLIAKGYCESEFSQPQEGSPSP
jgi:hypothetical protein